jgi:hypothetical protein
MRIACYAWRGTGRRSWRAILAVAVIGGLLGGVALGALAAARRTSTAYARYLQASNASDAFINVPGRLPDMPALRPAQRISALPAVTSAATYIGLECEPVVGGRLRPSFITNGLDGSLDGEYFRQDKLTVIAGRMPLPSATRQIVLSPLVARFFGVGVGGTVTYEFSNQLGRTGVPRGPRPLTRSFRVAAIAEVPPVLVDQADTGQGAIVPPGATRQLLQYYQYSWVGVRLTGGVSGIPALQGQLAGLATQLERVISQASHHPAPDLTFNVGRGDVIRRQVQQAIMPQVVALIIFGGIAGLALLALAGQGLTQLLARSATVIPAMRAIGATRAQTALTVALPGVAAVAGGLILAVAGAVAFSPLAPVGPVRRYDPARGFQADGLVLGAGAAVAAVILLGLLAVLARRAIRPAGSAAERRPSAIAHAAASAGLPASAVVGSRNALESQSRQSVPAWVTLLGSVTAVTAVVATAVFGASLTSLITHPPQYGWNWDVLLQAESGYGSFSRGHLGKLVGSRPAVAGWSTFGFSQLPVGGQITPVLGLQQRRGFVAPPTTSGHPLTASGQIELGTLTLRELGRKVGDSITVGIPGHERPFVISGTVTLPSFGVGGAEHVSLGRGAMLSEDDLIRAVGGQLGNVQEGSAVATTLPSAVAIDLVAGISGGQRAALIHSITSANPDGTVGGTYQLRRVLAAAMVNASGMGSQPLALALGLAAAAVLSLALTVLASVRRRRRELALLKTLGMTRGQLRSIVAWQTSVILVAAVVVSVPLGIASGRWAWNAFAASLGVLPTPVIPAPALLIGLIALLAAGNLLSAAPASIAARTPTAAILRAE